MGFVGVSGLTVATESIAYREGGYNTTVHQIPGQTSFQPISFSRGVMMGTDQNQQWMKQLFATVAGTADPTRGIGHEFRCNIDISVLSHPNPANQAVVNGSINTPDGAEDMHVAMRFRVYNAWINTLAYSDLSSGGNDLMVEAMSVVHEGWDLVWAQNYSATAPSFNI
jgi:phage tail-like protein